MTHPGNAVIRRQKAAGYALLGASFLFIILSSLGVVFPRVDAPDIRTVTFAVGSRVEEEDVAGINAAAEAMLDMPETIAIITGHTGTSGDPEANLLLSRQRAQTVADILSEAGIESDRIIVRGIGGAAPPEATDDESPAALAQRSKRAEIRIVERSLLAEGVSP